MAKDKNIEEQNEDFASMFEDSYQDTDSFEPGQSIETDIVSISGDSIFLQLSGKSEGVLNKEELTDKEGNLTVAEGDKVKAFFLEYKNGEMRFTTKISGTSAGQAVLQNAYANGIPVEGLVEKEIKGGFQVRVGEARAFCPYSQMGARRVEDASVYVGQHLKFKITEHSENGRNILVSNRKIHEEERQEKLNELKKELKVGQTVKGSIKEIRDFGAFVELDGIQALLPISEISRQRVEDIRKVLEVGQEIEASILKLDWQNEKFSLSMKALQADPWDSAAEKYKSGTTHKGKVIRIADFGAFVNLEPGLDGLVHVSEMKGESRDNDPKDFVKLGDTLQVEINSVDTKNKRISLKPVSSFKEDESVKQYFEEDSETYNPFAALLKDKVDKKGKKK